MPFITDYDIHDMPHSLKFDTSGKQRNFSEINTIQKLGWLVDYAYDHTPLMEHKFTVTVELESGDMKTIPNRDYTKIINDALWFLHDNANCEFLRKQLSQIPFTRALSLDFFDRVIMFQRRRERVRSRRSF